jgi:hypothetical protein
VPPPAKPPALQPSTASAESSAATSTAKGDAVPPPAKLPSLPSSYPNTDSSPYNPTGASAGKLTTPPSAPVTVPPPPVPVSAQSPGPTWKPAPAIAATPPAAAPAVKSDPVSRPVAATMTTGDRLGEPYVTTGVVIITDTPAPATPPSSPKPLPAPLPVMRLSPAAVKASIEKLCGPKIQSVEVKLEEGNKIAIQFAAPTEADGQLFFDRIQALPELAPYAVNVKVTTSK